MNLEKELVRQNRKLVTPSELLALKEYETQGGILNDDTLQRLGMTRSLREGERVMGRLNKAKADTAKFNQERVFHISQIESICMKYYLRFLPSCYYSGQIDKDLPLKVNTFEQAYGVKCSANNPLYPDDPRHPANTYIMAPKESFRLQEKPKDPLLFYKINNEYFYLIHKWGNDLNWSRTLIKFVEGLDASWLTTSAIIMAIGFGLIFGYNLNLWLLAAPIIISWVTFVVMLLYRDLNDFKGYFPKNRWDSEFSD